MIATLLKLTMGALIGDLMHAAMQAWSLNGKNYISILLRIDCCNSCQSTVRRNSLL